MKDLASVKELLTRLRPHLEREFHVRSLGIFGSLVRGDRTNTSDIDLIVDFDQAIGIEFVDLALYLESMLESPVDLVSRRGVRQQYLKQIEEEVIYV